MFVIFSTYIIEHCPYKKYARGKTILVTFWAPAPTYMASHGLAHASPRDAMWKTAGRHMGDAVSLSTLSISTMPKRYYHAHFPYRKDAFSENKS